MRNKIYAFFILLGCGLNAQTPTYYNTNVAAAANAFPLNNSATSRKVQWFIPANSIGTVTAGNNITDVYFQAGSTATRVYPSITIRMKAGNFGATGFTNTATGPVETGLTQVFSATNYTIASVSGNWIKFTLNTPWLYDPAYPLIVELEHNGTSGTGPTLYQAVSITGPGNGRIWADYAATNGTGTDTKQVNFGIDVLPATPCSGTPMAIPIVTPTYIVCPNVPSATLSFAANYSVSGLSYQWMSSTTSSIGPFANVASNANNPTYSVPGLTTTTWYRALVTCTNPGGGTYTTSSGPVIVANTTTNTVPYYEDFEAIGINNKLPNCSWWAPTIGSAVYTYTSTGTNLRLPHSGSSFGAFSNSPTGTNAFYSNGIWMDAGVTYSAGLWYIAEAAGYSNWNNLSISVVPTQAPAGATVVAATNGTVTPLLYTALSNTFTVGSSGLYYLQISATSGPGVSPYLSWDDLSVTIPCSYNAPPLLVSAGSSSICSGQSLNIFAAGADSFLWSTGATSSSITVTPSITSVFSIVGTNTLSGCSATVTQPVNVVQGPPVVATANTPVTCKGTVVTLLAQGASTYFWSQGGTSGTVNVTPIANSSYTVTGFNAAGCSNTSAVNVTVNPLPSVTAAASATYACAGEEVLLNATGANSYVWGNGNNISYQGSTVSVFPVTSAVFTVSGTDANGCNGMSSVAVVIDACTGLLSTERAMVRVFPNPTSGLLRIEAGPSPTDIELKDVSGKILMRERVAGSASIDLSSYSNGLYFIHMSGELPVKIIKSGN